MYAEEGLREYVRLYRREGRVRWPWLMDACPIRILIYADFELAFDVHGQFQGLSHVLRTLASGRYFWADFQVTLASRTADQGVQLQNATLDGHTLVSPKGELQYDELWLFGLRSMQPPLQLKQLEIDAVSQFVDSGGGVLITGDHDELGHAIGHGVRRAGQLRAWPSPPEINRPRLSTLRPGCPPGFGDEKQWDDVPQELRLRTYPMTGSPWWRRGTVVHPVMDSCFGLIDVFPDHMHEGEVVVPAQLPESTWPSKAGFQPKPEIVAWGRVVEPDLEHTGQEFGVVGAYDGHRAGVGRVVADSSWHHWFNINLIGNQLGPGLGFLTESGYPVLQKIESYFLNVASWLAPPSLQSVMRDRLLWGAMWRDPLVMVSPGHPPALLGEFGLEALSKYLSRSAIVHWVWDLLPNATWAKLAPALGRSPSPPLLEECLLGAALAPLLKIVRDSNAYPADVKHPRHTDDLKKAFENAVPIGLDASKKLAADAVVAADQLI